VRPAAITLDVLLPGMDGWEFLSRAKSDPALADIPVIIVSMLDERGRGYALGAADYVLKPVNREDLLAALGRLTQREEPLESSAAVLAIDDDPMAVSLIQAALEPRGYRVKTATSGEEGLDIARSQRPGLVILDLLMPGMDGFTVVEQLRSDPATEDIPVIILTAKALTKEERERLTGRISELARKSEFDLDGFVSLVRRHCRTPVA
jgi:CheY-like chemotaxis protein